MTEFRLLSDFLYFESDINAMAYETDNSPTPFCFFTKIAELEACLFLPLFLTEFKVQTE